MKEVDLKFRRKAWLIENGLTMTEVGKALGVSCSRMSVMLSEGVAPMPHVRLLREKFNMPEELLPRPSPGRWRSSNAA